MDKITTIDEYIANFPEPVRERLEEIRTRVIQEIDGGTEAISYAMPTIRLNGKNVLHFAAYDHHIGLYATPDGHAEFEPELSHYKRGKGSVQFPHDQPVPYDLIARIARFRAAQVEPKQT